MVGKQVLGWVQGGVACGISVGGVDVERGRGLGGFEGRRTGSSMSAPRRRRERDEEGGVGRDVRATQQELAPEPRGAGTALGLSVLLSQS